MSYFTFNETFSFDLSSCQNRNKFNYFKINSKAAERLFFPSCKSFAFAGPRKTEGFARRLFCESKKGFAEGLRMRAERRARRIAVRQSDPNPPGVSANGWYGVVASIEACGSFLEKSSQKLQRALGPGSTPGTGPQTNSISGLLHHH